MSFLLTDIQEGLEEFPAFKLIIWLMPFQVVFRLLEFLSNKSEKYIFLDSLHRVVIVVVVVLVTHHLISSFLLDFFLLEFYDKGILFV